MRGELAPRGFCAEAVQHLSPSLQPEWSRCCKLGVQTRSSVPAKAGALYGCSPLAPAQRARERHGHPPRLEDLVPELKVIERERTRAQTVLQKCICTQLQGFESFDISVIHIDFVLKASLDLTFPPALRLALSGRLRSLERPGERAAAAQTAACCAPQPRCRRPACRWGHLPAAAVRVHARSDETQCPSPGRASTEMLRSGGRTLEENPKIVHIST